MYLQAHCPPGWQEEMGPNLFLEGLKPDVRLLVLKLTTLLAIILSYQTLQAGRNLIPLLPLPGCIAALLALDSWR